MIRVSATAPLLAGLVLLSACASVDSYPSLARRPAERAYGSAPAATPSTVALPSPAVEPGSPLAQRIAAAKQTAALAHERFGKGQITAERLTAGSPAPQSDGWSLAQVAVSELVAARTQTSGALADLDHMLIETAQTDPAAPSLETIGNARGAVGALVTEEDAILARIAGRLRD
jgi:Meckel syndrome type 1 protein